MSKQMNDGMDYIRRAIAQNGPQARVEVVRWEKDRKTRDLAGCATNNNSPICKEVRVPQAEIYAIDVSFPALQDKAERDYLNTLPTSFVLDERLRGLEGACCETVVAGLPAGRAGLRPDAPWGYSSRGLALALAGQFDEALRDLVRAREDVVGRQQHVASRDAHVPRRVARRVNDTQAVEVHIVCQNHVDRNGNDPARPQSQHA